MAKLKETPFFLTFVGEKVRLITHQKITDTTEEQEAVETNLALSGFLLDLDDEYYYMGVSAEEVSFAVRKTDVFLIEIERLSSIYEELLENIESPNNESGYN